MKNKEKNEKYKVIVWGPGKMGSYAMHHFINSKEFELVGVRGFFETEVNVDAGTFLGIDPVGVTMTDDVEALLKLDADCVLFTVHESPTYATDDEILLLLAAGKNVVTTLPYHNLQLFRDADVIKKFDDACKKGNSTFYAGGVDPDIISDRMLLSMAGASADIKQLKIMEVWDTSNGAPEALQFIGYGNTPEAAKENTAVYAGAVNFQKSVIYTLEEDMGVKFDRVEEIHEYHLTDHDITEPFLVKAGTVARIAHRMDCYVDKISAEPFFVIELQWYLGQSMLPEGARPGEDYVLTVEGTPSLSAGVSFKVSNKTDEKVIKFGNRAITPNYVVTIMSVIQTIPQVAEAKAGLMPSFNPGVNWMYDLRDTVK